MDNQLPAPDKPVMTEKKKFNNTFLLFIYDTAVFVVSTLLTVYLFEDKAEILDFKEGLLSCSLIYLCIVVSRLCYSIYKQVWRYGGSGCYLKLIIADFIGGCLYMGISYFHIFNSIEFIAVICIVMFDLIAIMTMRLVYRYAYKSGTKRTFLGTLLSIFSLGSVSPEDSKDSNLKSVAIVGAGRVGVSLAEDFLSNPNSEYIPKCFIEIDKSKIGKKIHSIPVYSEGSATSSSLDNLGIDEVIFALPNLDVDVKRFLYERYKDAGFKIKSYDYPEVQVEGGKRHLRDFDIEELLFRKPIVVINEKTSAYYNDKVVLITGGGGSIGSELGRQLAKMHVRQLILLDIYENGVYDLQQELKIAYGNSLDVKVVIVSVTNKQGLERVFEKYRPNIVVHAAAHKHVPLMEDDCIEAVENNVFGTLNAVETSVKYDVERFIMVSTDKAVNPTNLMGATKRMCEMIVNTYSTANCKTTFSATRFGNVLGSAGSVIPLFKKQIAAGGPVTLTDKRIIRFFMTIPEASQLVLESGAMAENGQLFVLDMGQPVKIYDLAKNMISLSGQKDIEIIETGLRPGEKLYEELLLASNTLTKTDNELIFIEKDDTISKSELDKKLNILKEAISTQDNSKVKDAMHQVVETYK